MTEFQTHHIDFDIIEGNQFIIDQPIISRRVYIKNMNRGDEIVLTNGAYIQSVEPVLVQNCSCLKIIGDNKSKPSSEIIGGIQVAGDLKDGAWLYNLIISKAEHGLLMSQHTQSERYGPISIASCLFMDIEKEGVYIGNSKQETPSPLIPQVRIQECIFVDCGYDGAQVAKTEEVKILENTFIRCGYAAESYHDFDLTINPGCGLVYIERNNFTGKVQYLHSERIFVS